MRRVPLRTRTRLRSVNPDRKATLAEKQYGSVAFQAWCHRGRCQIPGCVSFGPPHMHHDPTKAAGGMWTDVSLLCTAHHAEVHDIGPLTFSAKYGVDTRDLAAVLHRRWLEWSGEPPEAA